ncbi:MAG: hypothetical protein AAF938_01530 [Myxococcota bacterium]
MSKSPTSCAVLLPRLPLQLLWKKRPEWRHDAVAIVADETPEAPILMLSPKAYERGLRPGLRQGAARNMALDLRTAVVESAEVEALVEEIGRGLQSFSPRVERAPDDAHGFFVDPSGFDRLYGGSAVWARTVHRYLRGRGLYPSIALGFDRFRCWAITHQAFAHQAKGPLILRTPAEEARKSQAVELRTLGFPERLCGPLAMLGVDRLGEFLELPAGQLQTRFGRAAAELHERYGGELKLPLQPMGFEEPRRRVMELLPPSRDRERLLFAIKNLLDGLLSEVVPRSERITRLTLSLHLERHGKRRLLDEERTVVAHLEPASPSADGRSLLELLRLRLARLDLPAAVCELALDVDVVPLEGEQLAAEGSGPRRDRHAAAVALAHAQASYGHEAVCTAVLREGHLPESTYRFQPLANARAPFKANAATKDALPSRLFAQRRVLPKPRALPNDGTSFHWPEAIVERLGPYRMNGGWWGKDTSGEASIDRDYYYARTASGEVLWVFFNRRSKRWFLHGRLD